MKKLLILLMIVTASCGTTREVYNLEMTLSNGNIVTRQYKLPDSVTLSIKGKDCLIYTKKDSSCYCIKRNVINFKRN